MIIYMKRHWIALGMLALLAMLPFFSSEYILVMAMQVFIWGVFAISYDLLIGYTGIVSFGHAMFFGAGAYLTALLMLKAGFNFWSTIPVVVIFCAMAGLIVGLLTLRFSDIYFTLITLALGEFCFFIVWKSYTVTGGDDGLHGIPAIFPGKIYIYYFTLVFLLGIYFFAKKLIASPFGTTLVALRENEFRARMIGYNVLRYKIIVLMISGIMAGLAGSINAVVLRSVFPGFLNAQTTLNVILMTIIGGIGTLLGPVLGAGLVTVSQQYLSSYFDSWLLIFGVMFVLVVLFLPQGIIRIVSTFKFRR